MHNIVSYNEIDVHYTVDGRGEPILLLHGFAEDGNIWNEQIAYFKNKYKVIVPDLPGSGASVIENLPLQLSKKGLLAQIDFYANCIHAIVKEEKLEKVVMIGHSMGGYITLAFAELYPNLLKGFGFVHSTAFSDSEAKQKARVKGIDAMRKYGAYAFIKNTTPNLFSAGYKKEFADRIAALIELGNHFTVPALQNYYRAMMNRKDRTHVLKSSKVPVLFIIGTEDIAVPLQDALAQAHMPNVAHVHVLEGIGHMGMWEASDAINKYIATFVAACNN